MWYQILGKIITVEKTGKIFQKYIKKLIFTRCKPAIFKKYRKKSN
jgi:hypothetical protein